MSLQNKMATSQSERKGLAFGAKNAPTSDELRLAMETGRPVELPGDPNSLDAFQRAAFQGSLAVIEDRMDIAGRRHLTRLFAEAARDPTMDPTTLTTKLDSAVEQFASAVGVVSPASGAKIGKSLGIIANSQVVQFSREWMARQTKDMKNTASASAGEIIGNIATIIQGYQPGTDENAGTLQQKLLVERTRLENTLILGGHDALASQKYLEKFDKIISAEQISQIGYWAQSNQQFEDDPLRAFVELRKFSWGDRNHSVPPRLQEMWKNMSDADKGKAFDQVMNAIEQLNRAKTIELDTDALAAERVFDNLRREVPDHIKNNNRKELSGIIHQYRLLGKFDEAENLQKLLDSNQRTLTSNETDLTRLTQLRNAGILNYADIAAANLTENHKREYLNAIEAQRDEKITDALKQAQISLRVDDEDLEKKIDHLPTIKQIQRIQLDRVRDEVYRAKAEFDERIARMRREQIPLTAEDVFNPQEIVEQAISKIQATELKRQMERQQQIIDQAFEFISGKIKTDDGSASIKSRDFFLLHNTSDQRRIRENAANALKAFKLLEVLKGQ
jgi:hypothetical protein